MTQSSVYHQEELLQAWIDMSLRIRGNRLVSGMSLNEIIICRILYEQKQQGGPAVTAADLCRRMQLLKSQINKILTSLEKQGLIQRVRSQTDHRKMELLLQPAGERVYLTAHERILYIMQHVYSQLGDDQSQQLTLLLRKAVQAIDGMTVIESERKNNERSNCN